tara:strand:+ start:87 stop:707 length:621 start_codon:yes stop_codon:yes gene_type:complete
MPKSSEDIKLSILILSIPSRINKLKKLLEKLESQFNHDQVEILVMLDNKSFHIYEKRNELLDMARGDYICFLDDDDDVSNNYIPLILDSIENETPDVICFKQHCNYNGLEFDVLFDISHNWDPMDPLQFNGHGFNDLKRPPFHMCPWRSDIAKSEKFIENYDEQGQSCEDSDWLLRLYPKVKKQTFINDSLHYYHYSSEGTESIVR